MAEVRRIDRRHHHVSPHQRAHESRPVMTTALIVSAISFAASLCVAAHAAAHAADHAAARAAVRCLSEAAVLMGTQAAAVAPVSPASDHRLCECSEHRRRGTPAPDRSELGPPPPPQVRQEAGGENCEQEQR